MLFAAVMHLEVGPSLETLCTIKVEKTPICSLGTQQPAGPITEKQLILSITKINNDTNCNDGDHNNNRNQRHPSQQQNFRNLRCVHKSNANAECQTAKNVYGSCVHCSTDRRFTILFHSPVSRYDTMIVTEGS